ncbi:MAG TPA: stage II sporulation protein E [Bacillota bacterium]|nr:stage II sporulation protein E [Bacillota bacterium]
MNPLPGQTLIDFQKNYFPHKRRFQSQRPRFRKQSPLQLLFSPPNTLWGVITKEFLNLALVFLLSRFAIPGKIHPAGIAFLFVSLQNPSKRYRNFLMLGAIFGGIASTEGLAPALSVSGILLIPVITAVIFNRRLKPRVNQILLLLLWTVLRLGFTFLNHPGLQDWISTGGELVAITILTFIFEKGFYFVKNSRKSNSKRGITALALISILALGGTAGLVVESVEIMDIGSFFLLMVVSYIGGGGTGAAMGIAIASILGFWSGEVIKLIALYSIAGFLGGFLKELGKMGTIAGGGLGILLVMMQTHFEPGILARGIPWGIGMASFLMIPKKSLIQASNLLPDDTHSSDFSEKQNQLKEIILNRLHDLADVFTQLAGSFQEGLESQPAPQRMDLYSLLDEVCTKNCQHCNGYENCWGENFYATYREIFDLLAVAELYGEVNLKHLKGRLAKSCFQQYKLLATVNHLFEKCHSEFHWRNKLDESKGFLADQLRGVSELIDDLASEIFDDVAFRTELEEKLGHNLSRLGLQVKQISVLNLPEQGLEINIKQRNCNQKRECVYLANTVINRLLSREYSVWERHCHSENGICSYCLVPAVNYMVKTTVCKLPKDGNEFSGDSQILHQLKNGNFVAILSDGMGNGAKAAQESGVAVMILNKLLEMGVDQDFALKVINSVLLLRSTEESFATVDLALINLYHGQAEFIKIGAASSYIKRGKEVWMIKSKSLPVGILNTVDIDRTVVQLQPGDLVIMATDGVTDSKPNQPGKEDWVIRALRQVEVVGPEALSEYLLSLAKINYDGILNDDLTVIVLQITKEDSIL